MCCVALGMGKSANKKKKQAGLLSSSVSESPTTSEDTASKGSVSNSVPPSEPSPLAPPASKIEQFDAVFLRRAHELKEEGNRRFQAKDYQEAMDRYEQALRLTPRNHPDRAVFHSNRAACLMQMKPVQYEAVITECSLALEVHPCFIRALFRRARALEALGKLELALQDVQLLLQLDSNHEEGLELGKRLRMALGNHEGAQQDMQERPKNAPSSMPTYTGTSPAAVGASVVRGSPVATRGPSLPTRPMPRKKVGKPDQPSLKVPTEDVKQNGPLNLASAAVEPSEVSRSRVCRQPKNSLGEKLSNGILGQPSTANISTGSVEIALQRRLAEKEKQLPINMRPLKLVYGHDIRRAWLPANLKYQDLRELVRKTFPASKAVLIKYKDLDGDLVTITCTEELRLAEIAASAEFTCNKSQSVTSKTESDSSAVLHSLRFHIVEVDKEQEPIVEEEDMEGSDGGSHETSEHSHVQGEVELSSALTMRHGSSAGSNHRCETLDESSREVEIDEWLLDFAQLFRTHVGVDPDAHIDLHELGLEFCTEALEETVTSEEAQPLFEDAVCKFQEVAALAFFNWGNVHMCAARKRIPVDEPNNSKADFHNRLQAAFEWAREQYELARSRYNEALRVKPDFYEGVLALGQESFESAKLRWSLAVSSQTDLTNWDFSETLGLFSNAEEKMQVASEMWEKLEEQRMQEVKVSGSHMKRELPRCRKEGHIHHELSEAEICEQFMVMRSQINLFWGNILFEYSQVEFKLGLPLWKAKLDIAVKKFELAGASASDIAVVLKNHVSNASGSCASSEVKYGTKGNIKSNKGMKCDDDANDRHECLDTNQVP